MARITAAPAGWGSHEGQGHIQDHLPQREIYVGKDLTGTLTYFGSPASRIIEADFTPAERRDFTVRKQVIWESETATDAEVSGKEVEYIRLHRSNDPRVGYNRWPPLLAWRAEETGPPHHAAGPAGPS
jgi:hypothetical protein